MRKYVATQGAITRQLRRVTTKDAERIVGALDRAERMAMAIDVSCWSHEHLSAAEERLCVMQTMLEQQNRR